MSSESGSNIHCLFHTICQCTTSQFVTIIIDRFRFRYNNPLHGANAIGSRIIFGHREIFLDIILILLLKHLITQIINYL